ncbi:hypothetical protein G6F46_006018 [Rhizopus delemar]|uniref:RING-type domain-containing protein n=2 Tax=Rhizopus TaxID=4842 RepID=A0A9P7CQC0_9FUNG|nr:hypothetical protein G6F55_004541 [Rhizopus delemar]KAG1544409.1 hypothetical protein G6F51_006076 [Rhizopus arrhizus]KAG1500890.1 hypothetical protein G6F54_003408 [Rhizopus delemar]KAG1517700.1 hypothetical protein G6F53_001166 [Rhizopus delemar]KAG1525921.1 hypothetical protein G6F52_002899 [Rhizopus delemar]
MPSTGYVFSSLDDDPIVHSPTKKEQSHSTSVMDHQNTTATLRSTKKPIAEDDKEEFELETFKENIDHIEQEGEILAKKDYGNFALLVILYLLQGIPVGLSFGSIPFLLKAKLSYSQIAVFSLSSWPYSLKLLWSPIVDALYSPQLGRRKSWIIPIQILTGVLFYILGNNIDVMMSSEHVPIYVLTYSFLTTIFFCATQDIAVDGWALTLLSKESLSYASTAQTIGLNCGYFLSFTVFLSFNSAEFSNKYLRSVPQEYGVLGLGDYMRFWAFMYMLVTAYLIFYKKEREEKDEETQLGIRGVYSTIWKICKLAHMKSFIAVLLIAKIGFICHEAVTSLKLLEKGFSREDLALSVLLDFPLQIFFGYYAAKWSNGQRPLKPWLYAFYGRLACSALGMLTVAYFPEGKSVGMVYFGIIMGSTVLSSFMSTVQFVSISAFMTSIADPIIGGTYMTLLNTFSNFGGTWPKFFVLEAVDYFTVNTCSLPNESGEHVSCIEETGKEWCKEAGGSCVIQKDGYYIVDGADGVIIYDDIPFQDDPAAGIQKISKGNITITMYYVDLDTGIELSNMIQYASNQLIMTVDNISYQPAINLVMHPDVGGFPADWIYILIIVIALLAVSFLASVGMHWHLWRIRRRQRTLFENGAMDMGAVLNIQSHSMKKVIDQASLSLFPVRIIGDDSNKLSRQPSINSTRSSRALENANVVFSTSDNTTNNTQEQQEDVCVICLDEFNMGEEVRKLPCGHEFHTECIDPWLTVKSASCPLCKYNCYIKQETSEENVIPTPPPSSSPQSFFSSLRPPSRSHSPASAFGPTISADRAEEFSRSWMARSLPRNMRRQIHEAAQAAAAAHQDTVIELPARMTQPVDDMSVPVPPPTQLTGARPRLSNRFKNSLPRFLRSS